MSKNIIYIFIVLVATLSCSNDDDNGWTDEEKVNTDFMMQPRYADVNSYLKNSTQLRVLAIGNSYTDDYTTLLLSIMENIGCDLKGMAMYELLRSSGSFKTWYDCTLGEDTLQYSGIRLFDGIGLGLPLGQCEAHDTTMLAKYMAQDWDVILIQQASQYAPNYRRWNSKSEAGYLQQWAAYINKHQPKALLGFFLIHSYAANYKGNSYASTKKRWQHISESVKSLQKDYPLFQFIIPCGTAIEDLRTSVLNDQYDLTRDGVHLGYGLTRFTAASCLYQSLFYPRTGIDIKSCQLTGGIRSWELKDTTAYPCISVTEDNRRIATNSVMDALEYPFTIKNEE